MRGFLRHFRGVHIWLLVNGLLLGSFLLLRTRRDVMNEVSARFTMPVEHALGRAFGLVPFSVAELFYAAAVIWLVVFLVCGVRAVRKTEYKGDEIYRRAMVLINAALSIGAALSLLWGVNFYADDFCDKSGIVPEPVSRGELLLVTRYFAEQASLCADQVPRAENGVCALSRREALDRAGTLYEGMYDEFPFLRLETDPRPKPILCSKVMSAMNVTGLYFPFTGESNLNMDFPVATFPATVAHELAHRRGIASEQQCNFLAILAATRSDDPAYRYSGWLTGYIHLSNALYTAAPEKWLELRRSLPASVIADLQAENLYWARYEGPVAEVSGKAYDTMLRGYGDELGVRSYGAVVDLLTAYYGQGVAF